MMCRQCKLMNVCSVYGNFVFFLNQAYKVMSREHYEKFVDDVEASIAGKCKVFTGCKEQ